MSRMWKFGAFLVLLATLLPSAASAQRLECGVFNATEVIIVPEITTTTSTAWIQLTGAALTRTFPNDGCVVIEFSSRVNAPTPAGLFLRVNIIAGAGDASPGTYSFITVGPRWDSRTVVFAIPSLDCSGSCTLRLEIRSANGAEVAIGRGVMRVLFNNDV